MRTELLPPGDNPIAVNKYTISYKKRSSFYTQIYDFLDVSSVVLFCDRDRKLSVLQKVQTSITFIVRLMHSIIQNLEVKIYVL
jgi:hypothetical protein